ncbi:MAG: GNAT family N-acetyltransferase [Acholeplasmataceae bacterium]|nr:GNAT family N-acetyltransferase [Acholeplasmataceae bacterium]
MDVMIDINKTILETDRLILRGWQESDLNDFYEYASVAGVGEMAGWQHHESIDVSQKVLQSFISGKNELAITYKENDKVIGSVGLHESWANSDSEYSHLKMKNIGYVLSKDYWGKGIMFEAVTAVIRFCFDECKLDALTCGHSPSNKQSKRVIEKCGFSYVKQSEYQDSQLQITFNGLRYILLRGSENK